MDTETSSENNDIFIVDYKDFQKKYPNANDAHLGNMAVKSYSELIDVLDEISNKVDIYEAFANFINVISTPVKKQVGSNTKNWRLYSQKYPFVDRDKLRTVITENSGLNKEIVVNNINFILGNFPGALTTISTREIQKIYDARNEYYEGVKSKSEESAASAQKARVAADRKIAEKVQAETAEETLEHLNSIYGFWLEKAGKHRQQKNIYFYFFIVIVILSIVGFILAAGQHIIDFFKADQSPYEAFIREIIRAAQEIQSQNSVASALLDIKRFVIPILGVAWVLRLVSRQFLEHLALESDAEQRVAMLRTFIALQRSTDVKLDAKERILILEALFRPVDAKQPDVAPPTISDFVSRSQASAG